MARHDIIRISREIADIQKGADLSIAVACQEADIRHVKALILGPPGTPYAYGFFNFHVTFESEYPSKPPKVIATTTNAGRCRFNPNIYATGKVCLSILGTWQGNSGEQWSSAQGLESILLSIQSLMSNNPFENEPGYENSRHEKDKALREAYCAKIRHETLRVAVVQNLESILRLSPEGLSLEDTKAERRHLDIGENNVKEGSCEEASADPEHLKNFRPFDDLLKLRFLWYCEHYLTAIEEETVKYRDGLSFETMPFEHPANDMTGKFQYKQLTERILRLERILLGEPEVWAAEGLRAKEQEQSIAYNLQTQYDQFSTYQKQHEMHNIDVSLLDNNPFVWIMTYFGRSSSNLEGGIFRIRILLSVRFPQEQPRVVVETKLYHHRVSKKGILCYIPIKTDQVKHHIEAIVATIEETSPPYDPRAIVHVEASKLLWGSPEDKKKYARLQRRSAADSGEETFS